MGKDDFSLDIRSTVKEASGAKGLTCITDLTSLQLGELVAAMGEPSFRAKQLQQWVYRRLAFSFDEMTDLPRAFREKLTRETALHCLTPLHELTARDGTVKTLFALDDDKTIESTLMSYPGGKGGPRHTVCVSTQAGCAVGCAFCATGQQGFERNLTAGEIIDQVLYFARSLRDRQDAVKDNTDASPNHVTNIVFMGMGEPLANYDALWQAIEMLNAPHGFGLGARSMVISTVGLVPQIERLGREKLQVGLAVSLHASDNALRDRLVPINRRYPLEMLIPACAQYFRATGRRITFEYALFDGINDSLSQARSLAHLLRGLNCHVNLIRANRTPEPSFRPSPEQAVLAFRNELQRLHITVTIREPRGLDAEAGCGQLRSRFRGKAAVPPQTNARNSQ